MDDIDIGFEAWWAAHRFQFILAPIIGAAIGLAAVVLSLIQSPNTRK